MKNFEIIAFSIDLARQKERVEFVKNQMKFCRANGYNTVLFAAYGEGAQYPVYAEHFDGKNWHAPVAAKAACGMVKDEQNVLQNNASFCVLGTDDGRAHLDDMSLGKQRNAIRIVF